MDNRFADFEFEEKEALADALNSYLQNVQFDDVIEELFEEVSEVL